MMATPCHNMTEPRNKTHSYELFCKLIRQCAMPMGPSVFILYFGGRSSCARLCMHACQTCACVRCRERVWELVICHSDAYDIS